MAFDYKTLRLLETSKSRDANDYCPECGRLWIDRWPEPPRPLVPFPWRGWFLTVVGVALALTFGLRAASAYRAEAAIQRDVAVETICSSQVSNALTCPSPQATIEWLQASEESREVARRQVDAALVATALGLLALVGGPAALVRRRLRVTSHWRPWSTLTALVSIAEGLLALVCFQVLAVGVALVAHQLSPGVTLTEALDRAVNNALTIISIITGA